MQGGNIFAVGTKTPGASNTFMEIGKIYGAAVFLLDAVKVVASILIAQSFNDSQWFQWFQDGLQNNYCAI